MFHKGGEKWNIHSKQEIIINLEERFLYIAKVQFNMSRKKNPTKETKQKPFIIFRSYIIFSFIFIIGLSELMLLPLCVCHQK